ncbi:MAG: porin [Hyphomonadaceae bacterium]|nr:porin [Hyphomonadaceae bacterium]
MKLSTGAMIGASWLALAGAAAAQTAPDTREQRIQELESRLAEIEAQLEDLKASSSADVAEVRRVASEQPVVTIANGCPTIASPDGSFRFALRGLFQFDAATYLQDDDLSSSASVQDLSSGANFRRARIGVEGTVFKDWNYALTYEAGGSGLEAAGLQQAWVEYAGWRPWGLSAPVRFRAGAFAVENTLEGATSNSDQLFLERPSIAEVVRSAFGGDGRNAFGIYGNGDRLSASLVLTGGLLSNGDVGSSDSTYQSGSVNDEGWGYVARLAALPLRGPESNLHVGVNYSSLVQLGDAPIGQNAIRLRDRPELRVDSQGSSAGSPSSARLIDTGSLSAESAQAYGLELAGQWGRLFLASEWSQIDVERPGSVADPSFTGYYVQAAYAITGERRTWNAANGGYAGLRPTNNFDPQQDKWGAWEIAARYSVLDLNDNEGSFGLPTPSGGVRGGEQTISTLGLNWYLNPTIRLLLDLQNVEIDRLNSSGAQVGQDYQAVALRTQVSF